jgi:hypothetical protein
MFDPLATQCGILILFNGLCLTYREKSTEGSSEFAQMRIPIGRLKLLRAKHRFDKLTRHPDAGLRPAKDAIR